MTQLVGRRTLIGLPLAACLPWAPARAGTPGGVAVGGTGGGLAPLRVLLESSKALVNVVPNLGSGGGLKALAAGVIDVALSARALSDAERAAGLVEREWFRTPLVWAVHPGVPAHALPLATLVDFYAGRSEGWGDGQPVRLVLRPESDSDSEALKAISPEFSRAVVAAVRRPGLKVAVTDEDAAADIERIPGALGTTTLAMLLAQKRALRVLAVDGVVPSAATLASGRWPYRKSITIVTRAQPAPEAQAFVQWAGGAGVGDPLARLGCVQTAAA